MHPISKLFIPSVIAILAIGCAAQLDTVSAAENSTENRVTEKTVTNNRITITETNTQRCFSANGLPDHPTGEFPNRGNPNAIGPQDVNVCVPLTPTKSASITPIRGTMGVAVNGVQFRPNPAGYYDPNGRRSSSLIGYAGDGYEIHYVGETVESGWALKPGTRPPSENGAGPGGAHDGTYNEDYIWVGGTDASGQPRLDECNGGQLSGQYVYFVTESYPFVSRCLTGVVSADFNKANHRAERGDRGPRGQRGGGQRQRGEGQRRRGGQ